MDNPDPLPRYLVSRRRLLSGAALTAAGLAAARPSVAGAAVYEPRARVSPAAPGTPAAAGPGSRSPLTRTRS